MIRRWSKPCPRCRANHLVEMNQEAFHVIRCVRCGYFLTPNEIRFLVEDVVLELGNERIATSIE
jgi:Zn ribbon nucleic-acid-binding protein